MFTCDVPENYVIREPKQCENCPISFLRDAGSESKYCPACQQACEVQEKLAFRAVARGILRQHERERAVGVSARQVRENARRRTAERVAANLLKERMSRSEYVKRMVWGEPKAELAV